MKVVQINAVYETSSTGRNTMELHMALQDSGIESYVFAADSPVREKNVFLIGGPVDRKLHGLCTRIFGLQGYFSHIPTWKLICQLRKIRPDVVHLGNLHGNYINLPMLMKYLSENPVATVVTLHDCWFFTGKCCYYTEDRCDRWKTGCGSCPALHKWNPSWFFDRSHKMYLDKQRWFSAISNLGVIGVSDWITNEAKQSFLGSAKICRRIYNWIDLDVFRPRDSRQLREKLGIGDAFVILGVSQVWDETKGLSVFLKLAQAMPECKVLLVGRIPEGNPLPRNVVAVGTICCTEKLAQYYALADVFFNPSIQETFGKVTAEALSCGTPVVGYNATATPELIGTDCGMIIDQNSSIEEIVTALYAVKSNGAEGYVKTCRKYACDNFNKDKNISEHISLYQELTDRCLQ